MSSKIIKKIEWNLPQEALNFEEFRCQYIKYQASNILQAFYFKNLKNNRKF